MRKPSTLGLLSATFLILAAPLTAQITFQRTYGSTNYDESYSVAQTADGGYIVAGYTGSFGAGGWDVWLIKTDASGDTTWTRAYGGTVNDEALSVQQTADSGYAIVGRSKSFGADNLDVYLLTTDALGDTAWTRTYGGTGRDAGYSVQQTADGGYIIAGYTESYGAGGNDVWLIKTDTSGDTTWTRAFGGSHHDEGYSVRQTADGGYIVVGYTKSYGAGNADIWLIKTDASGDTMWTRLLGGVDHDKGYSVAQTADGGFVIAGLTFSYGAGSADIWLIKTDASGDTMWTRTHGRAGYDEGYSVAQTANGGYVIAGYTSSYGAGLEDVWLVRTDASGDTMWTQTYGGANHDFGWSVAQTTDGGYVVAGHTSSYGAGFDDVWLIKTDSAGRVAIAEPKPPVAFEPVGATIVRSVLYCPVWNATTPSLRNVSDIALHNSAGRKVMDLLPGENDVRHLSPGVYFIRGKGSRGPGSEGPSRKVILTR